MGKKYIKQNKIKFENKNLKIMLLNSFFRYIVKTRIKKIFRENISLNN